MNNSIGKMQNHLCNIFRDCYLRFGLSYNGETTQFLFGYDNYF